MKSIGLQIDMVDVKLTKGGLRSQQIWLTQLERYLPTLQLKKSMLQVEVNSSKAKVEELQVQLKKEKEKVMSFASLLSQPINYKMQDFVKVQHIEKHYENIAGVEIPIFENVIFPSVDYFLFDTPPWLDSAILQLKEAILVKEKIDIEEEKKRALEKELKEVSIRVNLFEKILIPRAYRNIKKIKIFLSDQELAAVSQAKVAKKKLRGNEA